MQLGWPLWHRGPVCNSALIDAQHRSWIPRMRLSFPVTGLTSAFSRAWRSSSRNHDEPGQTDLQSSAEPGPGAGVCFRD